MALSGVGVDFASPFSQALLIRMLYVITSGTSTDLSGTHTGLLALLASTDQGRFLDEAGHIRRMPNKV